MKKLFKNKKGFTLMEMLIVVAIIVILVAVAMPVFSSQLTKAKAATNDANKRAAKAVGVAEYLTNGVTGDRYFDASSGKLTENASTKPDTGYGKAVTGTAENGYETVTEGQVIKVSIDDTTGAVTTTWENK